MTTEHTPGPWSPLNPDLRQTPIIIVGPNNEHVARVSTDGDKPNDAPARNARLIAAAPNLLAALRRLVSATAAGYTERDEEEEGSAWDEANEALAKAEGVQE